MNALFIVRTVVKFMIERIKEEDVINQFHVTVGDEEDSAVSLLNSFLSALIELLVETPLVHHSYHLHVEATKMLITLLSSVMYSPGKPCHQLTVWREMMTGEVSTMTTPLTCALLQR